MLQVLWCHIIKMRRSELHSAKEWEKAVPMKGAQVQAEQQSPALVSHRSGGICKGYWFQFQGKVGFITYFVQHFLYLQLNSFLLSWSSESLALGFSYLLGFYTCVSSVGF